MTDKNNEVCHGGDTGNVLSFDTVRPVKMLLDYILPAKNPSFCSIAFVGIPSQSQAMAHFLAMFPALSAQLIESVLRKHDGNVAQTIEELLVRSAENETMPSFAAAPSSSSSCSPPPAYSYSVLPQQRCSPPPMKKDGKMAGQEGGDAKTQPPKQQRDPCANDEKIALLIQNREFLRYLRHDPHFQRAVIGQHQASARYAHHYPLPSGPVLLASTRFHRSPNTGRLFNRFQSDEQMHLAETKERQRPWEQPQMVPNGPPMPFYDAERELAIPQGPLIDYVDVEGRESGWAGRIKAKLAKRPPEGSELLPPSPVVHYTDEQMRSGIHGVLERGGRGLLDKLAKKFVQTKGQNSNCCSSTSSRREEEANLDDDREGAVGKHGGGHHPSTMGRQRPTRGIQ